MADVRVLVVDDHPVFRAGMVTVLQDLDGLDVVGQAADGAEALARVAETAPDVVLMDLRMPGVGGLEATARLRVEHPDVAGLALTKQAMLAAATNSLEEQLLMEEQLQARAGASDDYREGVSAFLEKRPAKFSGR